MISPEGKVTFVLDTDKDKDGNVIAKRQPNPFHIYKLGITKVTIRDLDYSDAIKATLVAKQGAIQAQVTSKANADKAQQEAVEAKAKGEKTIAEAVAQQKTLTAGAEEEVRRAKLEAEATKIRADAAAYEKKAIAAANNSLDTKLDAWVKANEAWAKSTSTMPVVFGQGGGVGGRGAGDNLYPLLMMRLLGDQLGVPVGNTVPQKQ